MHEPTLSPEVLLPVPSAVALMLGVSLPQEPYEDGAVGANKLCLRVWFWLRKGVCWRVPKRGAESKPQTYDAEK